MFLNLILERSLIFKVKPLFTIRYLKEFIDFQGNVYIYNFGLIKIKIPPINDLYMFPEDKKLTNDMNQSLNKFLVSKIVFDILVYFLRLCI